MGAMVRLVFSARSFLICQYLKFLLPFNRQDKSRILETDGTEPHIFIILFLIIPDSDFTSIM
jgi:hypothetical protein